MKKIMILGFCLLGWGKNLKAQYNTVAVGGDAIGAGGTVAYSVGQIDYITANGSNGKITQGLQQPYEVYTTGIETGNNSVNAINAFPNPATDELTVYTTSDELKNLSVTLYDLQGKELQNEKFTGTTINLSLLNLANGTYLLNVNDNNKQLKQFKIIKTK